MLYRMVYIVYVKFHEPITVHCTLYTVQGRQGMEEVDF